jgi:hypothetical protein
VDEGPLLDALVTVGRRYAGSDVDPVRLRRPAHRPGTGAVLVRCGPVVVKAHAPGTDPAALRRRLAVAAGSALADVLLTPVDPEPVAVADRLLSVWPYGETVTVDPVGVPWAEAATLLARLHTVAARAGEAVAGLPGCGAPERLAGAVRTLRGLAHSGEASEAAAVVEAAWRTLPAWARDGGPAPGPVAVVHGDWHLGQLVAPGGAGWRLADVDDLGAGAPVWDFARLAALRALGVVREAEFRGFLDAYWAAGGPALRPGGGSPDDPTGWAALDAVARAAVVSMAARRLAEPGRTFPDALEDDLVRACVAVAAGPA